MMVTLKKVAEVLEAQVVSAELSALLPAGAQPHKSSTARTAANILFTQKTPFGK